MRAPKTLIPYLQLMRFDKPIGTLLLLWPTLWACWIASEGQPDGFLVWVFLGGVFVMRSAGCVINDWIDRDIDPMVERTKDRPLAAGTISAKKALVLFTALIIFALGLLLQLPKSAWPWSLGAALVTVAYPFMKRVFPAPQTVLGIAFSFSIPMVYAAFGHEFDSAFFLLIVANIAWVIAYDTAYAMSDREDDLKIGVKSTAILFGNHDRLAILCLQFSVLLVFVFIARLENLGGVFYLGLFFTFITFAYQQWLIKNRERNECFQAFLNNAWSGAFIWIGILLA